MIQGLADANKERVGGRHAELHRRWRCRFDYIMNLMIPQSALISLMSQTGRSEGLKPALVDCLGALVLIAHLLNVLAVGLLADLGLLECGRQLILKQGVSQVMIIAKQTRCKPFYRSKFHPGASLLRKGPDLLAKSMTCGRNETA